MSLSQRIVFIAAFITLVTAGVFSFVGKVSKLQLEQGMAEPVNTGRRYAWEWALEGQLKSMQDNASALESDFAIKTAMKSQNPDEIRPHADSLFHLLKDQGAFTDFQLVDKTAKILYSKPKQASGVTTKTFVVQALETKKPQTALTRDDDGQLVLGMAIPIKSRRGVYGAGVYLTSMQKIIAKMAQKDGGSISVLDDSGKVQAETESGLYSGLDPKLPVKGAVSLQTLSHQGKTYSVSIQGIQNQQGQYLGHLVSAHDITEHHRQSEQKKWTLILVVAFTLVGAILALWYFVRRSFRPLASAVDRLSELSQGDLTQAKEPSQQKDEIGRLNSALYTTTQHLREMVEGIVFASSEVVTLSAQLSGLSSETASRSNDQRQRVNQIVAATSELNTASNELAGNISNISHFANDTAQIAGEGSQSVKQVIDDAHRVSGEIGQLNEMVAELRRSSKNISDIIDVIKGISEQTNLLALNAAIEAARAGDKGRGFAVVADEVRKLSQNTQESVTQIEGVIMQIQQQSEKVTQAVESSKNKTEHSAELSAKAMTSLAQIEQRIDALKEHIDAGASAAEEMTATTGAIMEDTGVVNGIADQVSEDAKQVSQSSGRLQTLANDLSKRMGFFNTRG
jgi:methyl-accepting chemotaxis protein